MKMKRCISFLLAMILLLNTTATAVAEAQSNKPIEQTAQEYTVTLTADTLTGKLLPLENASTSMVDYGDYLSNAEGVVNTEI